MDEELKAEQIVFSEEEENVLVIACDQHSDFPDANMKKTPKEKNEWNSWIDNFGNITYRTFVVFILICVIIMLL